MEARLQAADVRHLPFEDAPFDAIICAHVLEHLDDPMKGISEMIRVLRPGGTLVTVATRRGVPDTLLRLRWRHTSFEHDRLVGALEEVGLDQVRSHPLAGSLLPPFGKRCRSGDT